MQFFHVIFVVFTTVINTNIILNLMFFFPNCSTRLGVNFLKDTETPDLSDNLGFCFSKSNEMFQLDVHAENHKSWPKTWPEFWFEAQIPKLTN